MRTLVAYVPVLHEGYRRFFEKYVGPKELYIFGPEITARYRPLTKEIRQLDPALMKRAVDALGIFEYVAILDVATAESFNTPDRELTLPDEDVSRELAAEFFPLAQKTLDPIFLRWDKHNALAERPVVPEAQIARGELHTRLMRRADEEAKKSSDIWRHVGALVARDGEPLLVAHNTHVPSEHMPYVNGDPRSNFSKGISIELSTSIHAEAGVVAEAARRGLSLEGSDMYVTVFPCPPCAKLIACAGIKNLYCGGGYGVLDGEEILKSVGVSIYFVEG